MAIRISVPRRIFGGCLINYILVYMYLEYHSVCLLVGNGTPTPTPASECVVHVYPLEPPKEGGTHTLGGEGVGERQLGRLEKKLSTLYTYSVGCY